MNRIILASHGGLSAGMKDTVQMILGELPNLYALATLRDETEPITVAARRLLDGFAAEDAVYIVTDVMGGSVNNEMLTLLPEYPAVHLICGTEIDFVKQHAYMLSEGDNNTVSAAEPAAIPTTAPVAVPNTEEYTGSWVQIMDEFEICLLPDWEEVELDEEDKAEGAYYAAKCVDQDAVLIVMAMDLTEGYTQEEIEAELAEGNFDSMLEVAEEALKQQGYTIEKTEVIHDIPCTFFSYEYAYGIVFMDQGDSVMDVLYFSGEDMENNDGVQSILHSVRWVG